MTVCGEVYSPGLYSSVAHGWCSRKLNGSIATNQHRGARCVRQQQAREKELDARYGQLLFARNAAYARKQAMQAAAAWRSLPNLCVAMMMKRCAIVGGMCCVFLASTEAALMGNFTPISRRPAKCAMKNCLRTQWRASRAIVYPGKCHGIFCGPA